jgi:hypothetical protein
MSIQIRAKECNPQALLYGAWDSLQFQPMIVPAAAQTSDVVQGIIPLGLNFKITHISYVMSNWEVVPPAAPTGGHFVAGKLALNVVSGVAAYEGAGAASSYAYLTLGGTFLVGDKITITIAGVPYVYTVSGRAAVDLTHVGAHLAESLNLQAMMGVNPAFNTLYRANSLGVEVVIQTLVYSAATPAFAVSTNSVAGTVLASGAAMVAGVAGAVPESPPLDTTNQGITPSLTADPGDALFPVDIVLPLFAAGQDDVVGEVYALESFDAFWPTGTELTLRITADGVVAGGLNVILWGVPYDLHYYLPGSSSTGIGFHISNELL